MKKLHARQKDPAAVALGRKGGLVKTAKGFATLSAKRKKEIDAMALASRRRNKRLRERQAGK